MIIWYFTVTIFIQMNISLLIDFGTILSGIIFVAVPFVIGGIVISSIIQYFVPQERILRFYGIGFWRNYAVSALAGFLFPICECGIVPIARSLTKKGVSNSAVVMFLLSAPIFNPITIGATIAAFPARPEVWIGRFLVSQIITLILGWIFQVFSTSENKPLPILSEKFDGEHAYCEVPNENGIISILKTTYHEFQTVFPYIVIGASITSALQLILPKGYLLTVGSHPFLAIISFMAFALVLSVCSSVDAFIILPFASLIPLAALLAFLNYGPLIDIKNILLFRAYFTKQFQYTYFIVLTLILMFTVFLVGYLLSSATIHL